MSRTFNTDPYPIQARRRGGQVSHLCDEHRVALPRWGHPTGGACTADRYPQPRLGCRWWVDVWGGHRHHQSYNATRRERADRRRVTAALRVAARVSNGTRTGSADGGRSDSERAELLESFDELDVPARRRDISWDLW